MASQDTNAITRTQIELREPPLFKIIYLNDNKTSVDFVVESLNTQLNETNQSKFKTPKGCKANTLFTKTSIRL